MSRISSWFFVCLDFIWVIGCFLRLPTKEAYAPVSIFLATCTGAAFTAYGVNSYAGARNFSVGINYGGGEQPYIQPGGPRPRAKPAPPEGA